MTRSTGVRRGQQCLLRLEHRSERRQKAARPRAPGLCHRESAALGSRPPEPPSAHCPRCPVAGACACAAWPPRTPRRRGAQPRACLAGGPGGPACLTTHVFVSVYVNVSCLALLFQKIIRHLEREGLKNIIFTNCVKDENVKQVGCFF